jgi:hypothetical protein
MTLAALMLTKVKHQSLSSAKKKGSVSFDFSMIDHVP